jgi:Domain of unknown function (DUF4124)
MPAPRLLPSRLRGLRRGGLVAACGLVLMSVGVAQAKIYTCVDPSGKHLTADRPIPECLDREQRELNKDGSQKRVVPPRMTPAERSAWEEQQRKRAQAEQSFKDAVRRDRNLLSRYPNQAAHDKARQAAMDDLERGIASSEKRIAELQKERKPLLDDAEFYKGKRLPGALRAKLDGNEASQQAQKDIIENQQAEKVRIHGLYDTELARLKKLWAGAPLAFDVTPPGR